MSTQTTPQSAHKRRTWKLALLAGTALAVTFLAWFVPMHIRHRQQWEAIALIERRGGSVATHLLAPEWLARLQPDDSLGWGIQGIGPNWVRRFLPTRYILEHFVVVDAAWADNGPGPRIHINISGAFQKLDPITFTDDDLVVVTRLPHVERLYLRGTQVTDQGVKRLCKLHRLRDLYLSSTRISDESAETLSGFQNLEILRLAETELTDAGLAKLTRLEHLEELDVWGTNVTPDGLKPFETRPGLTIVWGDRR